MSIISPLPRIISMFLFGGVKTNNYFCMQNYITNL